MTAGASCFNPRTSSREKGVGAIARAWNAVVETVGGGSSSRPGSKHASKKLRDEDDEPDSSFGGSDSVHGASV